MKSFIIKSCSFIVTIYIGQLIISNIFPTGIPQAATYFYNSFHEKKPDIAYLVDSTNYISDSKEKNHESISFILEKELKCATVGAMVQNGGHLDIFASYAKFVSRFRPLPDYLIVEINMRTFGAWDKDPKYEFLEQKLFFDWFAQTPLMPFWPFFSNSGFINFEPVSIDPNIKPTNNLYMNILRKIGFINYTNNNNDDRYANDDMKNLIHANYMYNLTKDHRKIQSLQRITDMFSSKKTKLIFYFTPIDYQPKEAYMGNDFVTVLNKNVNLVKSILLYKNVTVLDLSMSLPHEAFAWQSIIESDTKLENLYINEHLKELGRRFVAQSLETEIRKTFNKRCLAPSPIGTQ